eukprot:365750-Chlamydomonas_euryale.AAC.16
MCNRSCVHSGRSATLTRRKRLNMALRSQRSRSATGSSGPPTPVLREGSEAPETAAAAAVSSSTPPAPARSLPLLFSSAPAEQPAYESLSAVLACAACCSCGALRPPAACMLSMSSSMVPSIASISTVTSLVAPMRCARLTICAYKQAYVDTTTSLSVKACRRGASGVHVVWGMEEVHSCPHIWVCAYVCRRVPQMRVV